MGKGIGVETSKRAIILTKKAGIKPTVLLIAGNVGEKVKTINQTVDFLRKAQVQTHEIGSVGGLWILPGTKLYFDCKRVGFINDGFWLSNKPYKVYYLEHSKLTLRIFDYAYRTKNKLSKWKIINLIKIILFLIRNWLGSRKKALKLFFKKEKI